MSVPSGRASLLSMRILGAGGASTTSEVSISSTSVLESTPVAVTSAVFV
jgi:hypothetical protein